MEKTTSRPPPSGQKTKDEKSHAHAGCENPHLITLHNLASVRTCYIQHGEGTKTFPDGSEHSGRWRMGHRDGPGVFIDARGQKTIGNFRDDVFGKTEEDGIVAPVSWLCLINPRLRGTKFSTPISSGGRWACHFIRARGAYHLLRCVDSRAWRRRIPLLPSFALADRSASAGKTSYRRRRTSRSNLANMIRKLSSISPSATSPWLRTGSPPSTRHLSF